MRRGGQPIVARLRRPERRRSAALTVTLVLALLGGPAISALRNECDLCPPTCPMHQHHEAADTTSGPRLGCHAGAAGTAHRQPPTHERGAAVGRATCGNHGVVSATALPPMILPATGPQLTTPVAGAARLRDTAQLDRQADPPDTPPPIRTA